MSRFGRRRRQRKIFLGNLYLNPGVQYLTTIVSAIALAGFVFSGFLLFRYTDEEDLINRGKMQLAEGKVAWASKTFQTLLNHHRDSYEGHLLLGQAYLQLDERTKAQQEFELAASLKQQKTGDSSPEIALSKVALAQGDFVRAEQILFKAYRQHKKDPDARQALFELYEHWGNRLSEAEPKDYKQIVDKYNSALRYVSDTQSQQNIEEKLSDAIHMYTERLIAMKEYDQALHLLKLSLRFRYLPETLVEIAETYGQMKKVDESIEWYRKAFEVNPDVVGLRLANVLVEKGQKLVNEKKKDEAQKYFEEADKVSQAARIPLDNLYPVTLSNVRVDTDLDDATGEFAPSVSLRLTNDSSRALNYLAVKAEFVSGNETLDSVVQQVAKMDSPLAMNDGKARRTEYQRVVELKPDAPLNMHSLHDGKLTIKISIAYRDGTDAIWKVKSIQEATVRGSSSPAPSAKPV